MSKRIILTMAVVVCVAILVQAAPPPPPVTNVVNFNTTNPNVTVTAQGGAATSAYQWEGTAQFTLTGTGSAVGTINSGNTGVFESYTNITGQPTVFGGYSAASGDFSSAFNGYSYMLDGPAYFGHGTWSTHSISATGVTAGTLTVSGDATAVGPYNGGHGGGFVEGGQSFSGTAESVTVFGSKMDSTKQGIDPATWDPTKFTGAEWSATANAIADETITFNGATDAGTYYQGGETSPYQVLGKQGLGFGIQVPDVSTLAGIGGVLTTTYSYTSSLTTPTFILGDTSTTLTPSWPGVPGFLTNP